VSAGPSADHSDRVDRHEATSIAELLTAVALGRGLALVPQSLSRIYCWPGVTFLPVLGLPPCELIIALPSTSASDTAARFVKFARAVASGGIHRSGSAAGPADHQTP